MGFGGVQRTRQRPEEFAGSPLVLKLRTIFGSLCVCGVPCVQAVQENMMHWLGAYPHNQGTFMALFIFFPLAWVPLLLGLAVLLQKTSPSVFAFLTGGRSKRQAK